MRTLALSCLVFWTLLAQDAATAQPAAANSGRESPNPPVFQRWAVLASAAIEETGLADLLTAALSERDFELVERDQLRLATAELELSALFGSAAAGQRLKLGRLVKADALVLISFERPKKHQEANQNQEKRKGQTEPLFVKLVISDCIYGARLCLEFLPYAPDQREQLVTQIASLVERTRRRFAGGIQRMVSVSHFVSNNLTHEFDHLQAGYAYLLESALVSLPNVAVVETEEARAIGAELATVGEAIDDPVVPLLVHGEFEMSRTAPSGETAVHLVVRVSDATSPLRTFDRQNLALAEVRKLLAGEIPALVANLLEKDTSPLFSPEQQKTALLARAGTFDALGAWDHAAGLREAALVLAPDDWELRLLVIGTYRRLWRADQIFFSQRGLSGRVTSYDAALFEKGWQQLTPAEKAEVIQVRERFLARWRISMQHVEGVVRSRKVSPREAALLLWMIPSEVDDWALPIPQREPVKEELYDFQWRIYALMDKLDPSIEGGACRLSVIQCLGEDAFSLRGRQSAEKQYFEWTASAIWRIQQRYVGGTKFVVKYVKNPRIKTKDDRGWPVTVPVIVFESQPALDDLYRFLSQIASQEMPPLEEMSNLLTTSEQYSDGFLGMVARTEATLDELRAFYDRLKSSDRPLNVFYGRVGQLTLDHYVPQQRDPDKDLLAEADALLQWLEARGCNPKTLPDGRKPHDDDINAFVHSVGDLREAIAREAKPPASGRRRYALPQNRIKDTGLSSRVVFELVAEVEPCFGSLAKCTDTMDVMASSDTVYVMREKGVVKPIYTTADAQKLGQIAWDGESFWIATAGSGVRVVSPGGLVLGEIGPQQGLPPDTSLFLHPIEPGKCLAIGSLIADQRQWFAVLSRESPQAGYRAKIFYKALKRADASAEEIDDQLDRIFDVGWAMEYRSPKRPGQRLLLLGRAGSRYALRRPLAVDLATLEVSFFDGKLPGDEWRDPGRGKRFFSTGERLLWLDYEGVYLLSPPEDPKETEWSCEHLVKARKTQFLAYQGKLYVPGEHWLRVDPKTLQSEKLTEKPLPRHFVFGDQYSVSAHYGLVAWDDEKLYRVLIDPAEPPPLDLAQLYPYVPPEHRELHHRAVLAIKELGGSVGWGELETGGQFVVYLSRKWKGGDDGLAHLKDLYHLSTVQLIGAPITDAGLDHLAQLDNLHTLYLLRTEITNQGLARLPRIPHLSRLHLESTPSVDDAGLEAIGSEHAIRHVVLYGRGFTDAALPHLKKMDVILIELFDTAITRQAVAKFKKSNPQVSFGFRTY